MRFFKTVLILAAAAARVLAAPDDPIGEIFDSNTCEGEIVTQFFSQDCNSLNISQSIITTIDVTCKIHKDRRCDDEESSTQKANAQACADLGLWNNQDDGEAYFQCSSSS
ncbi:uncharacterized protein GIQ15_02108 [Arthroderma uncinatum]|uniref:uncharacterized protein n=1 Tax=Arthroderma uncinatum TaxID=74035 RepID=UPI00144A742D|nr:uncharacterized protein GIQ15_02108 [Arthroderma uncinatum]KAF3482784.1 hypothetical protein GIQ15_02108 [Arthroderma uncinatum]